MNKIMAFGFVIYSYGILEQNSNEIISWLKKIEDWIGHSFTEYNFAPRGKESHRVNKLNPKTFSALSTRICEEKPWSVINIGWPEKVLMDTPAKSNGIQVTIKSSNQPWRGGERYRAPSYLACIIHPEIIEKSNNGITGFLELGKEAWNISQGVYGFIDIETGIPLQDNIYRNFDLQMSNLIPLEFFDEFRNWQRIGPELHRKAWKVFWGNFLGEEHIQQVGGLSELKKDNPYKQTDELAPIAYKVGLEKITACKCFSEMRNLTHNGVLIMMSNTPYDWDQQNIKDKKGKLQQVLSPIIVSS